MKRRPSLPRPGTPFARHRSSRHDAAACMRGLRRTLALPSERHRVDFFGKAPLRHVVWEVA